MDPLPDPIDGLLMLICDAEERIGIPVTIALAECDVTICVIGCSAPIGDYPHARSLGAVGL